MPSRGPLRNAITADRVAQCVSVLRQHDGVGKTTMARILAKALNCLNSDGPTPEPCCKCESCQAVAAGTDIDVIEIDAASNTGVDHIRELRQSAIYRPARARFKIYIIDEVHMLSVSAFNALLKTLEEPPAHVKFILATTEPIRSWPPSRAAASDFDFRNIGADDIAGQLHHVLDGEGRKADDAVIRRVARLAAGSMRDALSLLDQLLSMAEGDLTPEVLTGLCGSSSIEQVLDLADAMLTGDLDAALRSFDAAAVAGIGLEQLSHALQGHIRDSDDPQYVRFPTANWSISIRARCVTGSWPRVNSL